MGLFPLSKSSVTPSPSMETEVGRRILAEYPGTTGSLGCAISEAVEVATTNPGYRYVLGSVLNQVLLHQSVIGLETKAALDKYGVKPDIIIGCARRSILRMASARRWRHSVTLISTAWCRARICQASMRCR